MSGSRSSNLTLASEFVKATGDVFIAGFDYIYLDLRE